MTLKKDTCQFEYLLTPEKACTHPALEGDRDNYCLFHSRNDDKDKAVFRQDIQQKLKNKDFDFEGYYFPPGLEVEFTNVKFTDANFRLAIFKDVPNFSGAQFSGEGGTDFRGAQFSGEGGTDFRGVKFSGKGGTDFSWAQFSSNGGTHFYGTQFSGKGSTDFRWAKFSGEGDTDFNGAQFSGEGGTDFRGTQFSCNSGTNFYGAQFSGKGRTDFSGAQFSGKGGTDFSGVKFLGNGGTHFYGTQFSGEGGTDFRWAKFSGDGGTDFRGVKFSGEGGTSFSGAQFSGKGGTTFSQAEFSKENKVAFVETRFLAQRGTDFTYVKFSGEVIFHSVALENCIFYDTDLRNAQFIICDFASREGYKPLHKTMDRFAHNKRLANIIDKVDNKIYVWTTRPDVLRDEMDEDEEKGEPERYKLIARSYQQLKRYFHEEEKDYARAGDFFYGEMECKRKAGNHWPFLFLYKTLNGYGERYLRALFWMVLFIFLVFPVIYTRTGVVISVPTHKEVEAVAHEKTNPVNLDDKNNTTNDGTELTKKNRLRYDFVECVFYSARVATIIRLGSVESPPTKWGRAAATAEGVLAPILIALFILALRSKLRR